MTATYRGMNREALDIAYNNVRADPDYQPRMASYKDRSEALYGRLAARRDIAYGDRARQRFDWLPCGREDAPTFVFIHGGYWQNYRKEDLAFVANGALTRGFNVVIAEYTLAPDATMTEIVGEIGRLLDFLQNDKSETGFGGRAVCLCGHSAGGQLASLHRGHPAITLTLAVSALFDLEPIALSWLNEKLRLTQEEIVLYSPMSQVGRHASAIVSVGQAELPELIRQSRDYVDTCNEQDQSTSLLELPDQNHFSILDDLADPYGKQISAVVKAMGVLPSHHGHFEEAS